MAEAPSYQRRYPRRAAGQAVVRSIENNVAELIANDMRHLELEDAAKAREAEHAAEDVSSPRPVKETDEVVSSSDIAPSSLQDNLHVDESERETVITSTRDTVGETENTSETRSSWRNRLGREGHCTDAGRRPLVQSLSKEESKPTTSLGSRQDRYNQDESSNTNSTSSWRDRLNRDDSSHEATGSWRDRLGQNSTSFESSTGSSGSWRDRLRQDESSHDTSMSAYRSRLGRSASLHEPATSSWRSRLSRDDNAQDTSVSHRDRFSTDDNAQEYKPYRRGSWRERVYGEENRQETAIASRETATKEDSPKLPQEYVPGSYRRGSWRERLLKDDNIQDTLCPPWSHIMSRAQSTSDAPANLVRDRPATGEGTDRAEAPAYRPGSWRERLRREVNDREATSSNVTEPNSSSQSNTAATERNSLANDAQMAVSDENVTEADNEVFDDDNARNGGNDASESAAGRESGQAVHETVARKDTERSWTTEDVLKLLIKAINYRSPLKDLETILKWQFDVNLPHKSGLRPLHYAAYNNYVDCVEMLLNKGANINITDELGYTPLHLAARAGNYKTMKKLIENGAMVTFNEPGVEIKGHDDINKLGFTTTEPVNLAIGNYHPECAELLLKNGARPDNKYFMGYEISLAPLDDIRCIEVLLKYGASPDVYNRCGMCPLMKACKDHRIDAVRLLLQHGADYNAQCPPLFEQKSVLQIAIESGNIVIVNLLLMKNPKITRNDNHSYSPLHTAIMKGRSDICRLLLQKGADPEERTESGATPLMITCSTAGVRERKEIIQMLLDCGADVNSYGENFSYVDPYLSPLAEYLKNIGSAESFSIVETLIRNGARVHYCTGDVLLGGRRDPFAILPFTHTMQNSPEIFDMTMQAAQRYNPLAIHACDSLPEDMKNILLSVATQPRDLKHTVRLALRDMLMPDLFDNVTELPLPELIKSYLLYK